MDRDATLVRRAGRHGAYYLFLEPPFGVHYYGTWRYDREKGSSLALLRCARSLARYVVMMVVVEKAHDEIWLPGGTARHGEEGAAIQREMYLEELQRIDSWPFDSSPNDWSEKIAALESPSL